MRFRSIYSWLLVLVPGQVFASGKGSYSGRDCSSESFFIEQESGPGTVPLPLDFGQQVRAALSPLPAEWFTVSDPWKIEAEVVPVLPMRELSPGREIGHLKFYRVYFTKNDKTLKVNDDKLCAVVQAIKTVTSSIGGQHLRVGRECSAIAHSVFPPQTGSSEEVATWHLQRIGAISSTTSAEHGLTVALLDTAVFEGEPIRTAPAPTPLVPETWIAGDHVHGTAMARLIRSVAPDVDLVSIPMLDGNGAVTTATPTSTGTSSNKEKRVSMVRCRARRRPHARALRRSDFCELVRRTLSDRPAGPGCSSDPIVRVESAPRDHAVHQKAS